MRPSDQKTYELAALRKKENAERDKAIVEVYLRCGIIHETRQFFGFIHSAQIVRSAISRAGVYDKCKRDQVLIQKAKNRKVKPASLHDNISKQYRSELELQKHIDRVLTENGITYESEVQVNGCGMRADFTGSNWAIETKKQSSSQGMLTAMAQCLVYRRHLNKRFTCILLPDDLEPADFYVSECLSYGIPVIKMSQLVWWVNTVQNDAQPN